MISFPPVSPSRTYTPHPHLRNNYVIIWGTYSVRKYTRSVWEITKMEKARIQGVQIAGNYMIVFQDFMRNGPISYTIAHWELMLGAFVKLQKKKKLLLDSLCLFGLFGLFCLPFAFCPPLLPHGTVVLPTEYREIWYAIFFSSKTCLENAILIKIWQE